MNLLRHLLLALFAAWFVDRVGGDKKPRNKGFPGVPNARPLMRLAVSLGIGLFMLSITISQCKVESSVGTFHEPAPNLNERHPHASSYAFGLCCPWYGPANDTSIGEDF